MRRFLVKALMIALLCYEAVKASRALLRVWLQLEEKVRWALCTVVKLCTQENALSQLREPHAQRMERDQEVRQRKVVGDGKQKDDVTIQVLCFAPANACGYQRPHRNCLDVRARWRTRHISALPTAMSKYETTMGGLVGETASEGR